MITPQVAKALHPCLQNLYDHRATESLAKQDSLPVDFAAIAVATIIEIPIRVPLSAMLHPGVKMEECAPDGLVFLRILKHHGQVQPPGQVVGIFIVTSGTVAGVIKGA